MDTKAKFLLYILFSGALLVSQGNKLPKINRFICDKGNVSIKSVAALELIKAKSNKLRGLIDADNQTFAWSVEIRSFQGFNSPLQQVHFNENYMESTRFTKASFTGKIIEPLNFPQAGLQAVRAKGILTIHGVEQERIIKSQLEYKQGKLFVSSSFTVPVSDHNIAIPRVVHQKIAEAIEITIEAVLTRQ